MVIKKRTRSEKKVSNEGIVWEYNNVSSNVDVAVAKMNGRMPDEGWAVNTECEEILYVISGYAEFHLDNETFDISEGDIVTIKPDQKFYYVANNLKIVISTSPPWHRRQFKNIE